MSVGRGVFRNQAGGGGKTGILWGRQNEWWGRGLFNFRVKRINYIHMVWEARQIFLPPPRLQKCLKLGRSLTFLLTFPSLLHFSFNFPLFFPFFLPLFLNSGGGGKLPLENLGGARTSSPP